MSQWFDSIEVLAELSDDDLRRKLAELEPNSTAGGDDSSLLDEFGHLRFSIGRTRRLWDHANHVVGHIGSSPVARMQKILPANSIEADETLRGSGVDIRLGLLQIADYPGGGIHNVLLTISIPRPTDSRNGALNWNAMFRVRDGERAGVHNLPLLLNVQVEESGLTMRCSTINVKNEADSRFLDFLESDVLRSGLRIGSAFQPALLPLSEMVVAVTATIAKNRRNFPVQKVEFGLGFSGRFGARLAEGSYVVVQLPSEALQAWDWSDWAYNTQTNAITTRYPGGEILPYNHFVLNVTRSRETPDR